MSLVEKIQVNINYTRSINLERDADSVAVVKAYIPTTRALDTLARIGDTITTVSSMPRAWTLMGPYGSGKSSFAVFLSHLLGAADDVATDTAQNVLAKCDEQVIDQFWDGDGQPLEHCRVFLTGSPEPLSKRLATALLDGATAFFSREQRRFPLVLEQIRQLTSQDIITVTQIIDVVSQLQEAIAVDNGYGLLIVIDELGKFLEYEARHPEANDIHLLQALAEHAYKGCEREDGAILSIFVLLHQSFEQYARGLGRTQQNEWAKVQGRFEVIPFLESAEQTLRIVGKAIEQPKKLPKNIAIEADQLAAMLADTNALPSALNQSSASQLFQQCYPLHPVSALLLPLLCQKIAQNERTLFNYLGSHEAFGFQDSLKRLEQLGDWIYPWEIYDYFISNQPAAVVDHLTHRRWAEVVTALERLGDDNADAVKILKTVGLLNLIGAQAGLKASKDILAVCLKDSADVDVALDTLQKRAVLQLRKYNNEYRVWQGSDFDLEARLQEERGKLGVFSLAERLSKQHGDMPIVARKFSIQKGSMQYFTTAFIDAGSLGKLDEGASTPRIVFYLAEDRQDEETFTKRVVANASPLDVLVNYPHAATLRDAVADVLALEAVQNKSQELHSDPVAQREFRDYYQLALKAEEAQVYLLLEQPQRSHWFWQKKPLPIASKQAFQSTLSDVLGKLYCYMPEIKNELINRDKPSSQAAAGRNRLLEMMLFNSDQEYLGIEKFPPEKAMYLALLHATGVHQQNEQGKWDFRSPPSGSSLHRTWAAIEEFLDSTDQQARAFSDLNNELTRTPYGLKQGVLPVLYLAAYLVHQDELALYEEGRYVPTLAKEVLERFVKTPELFKVQLFRVEGIRASIFKQYVTALFSDDGKERSVVQAIKPLATFVGGLNEYTQKTSDLSEKAKAFRNAFHLAKSPEQLLFEGIPQALGFDTRPDQQSKFDGYVDSLKDTLSTLKHAYSKMLEQQQGFLAQALRLKPDATIPEMRRVTGRYLGLDAYTVDTDGLKAFINRLTNTEKDDNDWFISILMFIGKKSPEKWLDGDKAQADMRLNEYSRRMLDLEALRIHDQKRQNSQDEFDVILLKSIKKGGKERQQPVAISKMQREATDELKSRLNHQLFGADKELQLAVLAELVDDFLRDYQTTQRPKVVAPKQLSKVKHD
ncbi:hypothetical protein HMY34_08770 [Thiothrix subterranea]|uniref:hypothetical protein n=1 Tax=Thiothrix subterranea TaxID=2735563 RepID=UPI00192AD16E|nr:hypothetical protein [Thiothrix subterranea]QQZ28836.1 hypothetical protein HMY34_08770 [Thiothrix subterranea]